MSLSSAEREAIALFDHATVRSALIDYGWDAEGVCGDCEVFENDDFRKLYLPLPPRAFEGIDNQDLVFDFAEAENISTERAIALLSGKTQTIFEWHDPSVLPPVGVPLIVDIDGKHRAAEFDQENLKFCNGMHVYRRTGDRWSCAITSIAWQVQS
jgi:hypothetical protein